MKVALTGHRPQRLGLPEDETNKEWWWIRRWVIDTLYSLMYYKQELHMYSGMADGCDYLFAQVGICLRNVKLHCILPCKNYNSTHKLYEEIKERSYEWVDLSDDFYNDYPHNLYPELLEKKERPYNCLLFPTRHDFYICIPLGMKADKKA